MRPAPRMIIPVRCLCILDLLVLLCMTGYWVQAVDDVDPCLIYSTYDDAWRDPSAKAALHHCDSNIREGWYTFKLGPDRAQIPTTCVQDNTCGGRLPLHVDLEGQEMPGPGETINASLCGSYAVLGRLDCCVFRKPVEIKQCREPSAIIYRLPSSYPDVCPLTICAVRVGKDQVDRQYMYKAGDIPRSVQMTSATTAAPHPTPEDMDECSPPVCQNGLCVNTSNGSFCQCYPGFEPHLNDTACRDVDECADMAGGCGGEQCHNMPGAFFCSCPVGYRWGPHVQRCVDIDECEEVDDVCRSSRLTCNNTEGAFACDCAEHYTISPDGLLCLEVTTPFLSNTANITREQNTTTATVVMTSTTATARTASISVPDKRTSVTPSSVPQGFPPLLLRLYLLQHPVDADSVRSYLEEAIPSSAAVPALSEPTITVLLPDSEAQTEVVSAIITFSVNASEDVLWTLTVKDIVNLTALQNSLPRNLTLLVACTRDGRCTQVSSAQPQSTSSAHEASASAGYTNLYLLILIVVVVAIALCLLTYLSARLYKHCSQQGTWVLPQVKKKDEESAQAAADPRASSTGDGPISLDPNNPDATKGENNGEWSVVPLDEAPNDNVDSNARVTHDTPM